MLFFTASLWVMLSLLAPRSSGDEMGESSGNGPLDNIEEGGNDGVKTYANEVKMLKTLLGGKESGKNLLGRMIDIEKNKGNGLELRNEGWDLPASCPTNGHLSLPNGKRYVAPSEEQVDYATAQARCAAEGGTVALPLDSNEQAYLVFFKNCRNKNARFWLGVSRPDGTWVDSQGSALGGFSVWAPGEPNQPSYLCSHLVFGTKSDSGRRNKWADAPCGESFTARYICETKPNLGDVINDLCGVTPKLGRIFPEASPAGRYKYDFDEAKHACEQKGASLATYHQLYEAWQDGLEHCHCGWLSDGTSRYPVQTKTDGCGKAGINKCGRGVADAWCFRTLSICD